MKERSRAGTQLPAFRPPSRAYGTLAWIGSLAPMNAWLLLALLLPSDTSADARLHSIREYLHPIRAIEPAAAGVADDFADLMPLKAMIGEARIVGLGEGTHGTREFTTLRHRIARFLATECGFDVIAIEGNFAEGERLFELVRGAPGSLTDATRDLAFWCWTTRELEAVFEDARGLSAATPTATRLDVVGIDMQLPRASIETVLADLERRDPITERRVRASYAAAEQSTIRHGTASAELPIEAMGGATLQITAWLRTEDVGAGDVQLFARADGPSGFLARSVMDEELPGGTRDFTRVSVLLGLPDPTTRVQFGVLVRGERGTVWIDDVTVLADGRVLPLAFDGSFELAAPPDAPQPPQPSGSVPPAASTSASTTDSAVNPAAPASELALKPALAGRTPSARHALELDATGGRSGSRCIRLSTLSDAKVTSAAEAANAANDALAAIDALLGATPDDAARRMRQHARVVAQGFAWNADPTRLSREVAMADNLAWWRERLGPDTKIIVWAHNGHIGRDAGALGDVLAQRFGKDYVAFATATGRGRYRAEAPLGIDVFDLATPPRTSVESTLLRSGSSACVLDLRRADADARATWLADDVPFRFIGIEGTDDQFQPTRLTRSFDGLLWIAETSPTTPLG